MQYSQHSLSKKIVRRHFSKFDFLINLLLEVGNRHKILHTYLVIRVRYVARCKAEIESAGGLFKFSSKFTNLTIFKIVHFVIFSVSC